MEVRELLEVRESFRIVNDSSVIVVLPARKGLGREGQIQADPNLAKLVTFLDLEPQRWLIGQNNLSDKSPDRFRYITGKSKAYLSEKDVQLF